MLTLPAVADETETFALTVTFALSVTEPLAEIVDEATDCKLAVGIVYNVVAVTPSHDSITTDGAVPSHAVVTLAVKVPSAWTLFSCEFKLTV